MNRKIILQNCHALTGARLSASICPRRETWGREVGPELGP